MKVEVELPKSTTLCSNSTEISNHLKNSLCEVLNLFYPLAGRIKNNQFIHCNDEGIPFVEARVLDCTLSDVLSNPIPGELNKFMPFELDDITNSLPLGVQLNIFPCGGFAIGQCISHKIADGLSYFMFSKIWAAIARGDQANINPPEFVSSTLFPPKEFNIGFDSSVGITKDRVTKRFVFDASQIENLRERYEQSMHNMKKRPTRVETLSTFLWSRFVAATKDSTLNKLYRVVHAVNLRPRFDPPLPQSFFGNLFRLAITAPLQIPSSSGGSDEECGHGVVIPVVREAIDNIDNEYIKKLQKQGLHGSAHRHSPYKNVVLFMDTKEGGGIEAYVSLEEEVMAKFECDSELLSYVAPTGRVLLC
ncbi:hypothetical protein L3X38_004995 [Prunus dulcis]|uniref:HXXXD-type acyl-transferase family protein n=1 Tax=Prunus dulcis TaxID=3755 RepID=A0AAD4ZQ44_PRUDU|nr:hypothetical protein L3X38_004995 [Prunus dulcis]